MFLSRPQLDSYASGVFSINRFCLFFCPSEKRMHYIFSPYFPPLSSSLPDTTVIQISIAIRLL